MIRYNTTDIIKRAEQLSDLENSDFISDYEKVALLNEAWQILYQKIINANDKSWVKKIHAYNGMELPRDLYQISAIYIEKSLEQIHKRNASQRFGYEIADNHFYLSENYHGQEIVMEYYPVPKSMKLKEKTVDAPFPKATITANKNIYAMQDESDLILRDIESDYEYNLSTVSYDDIAIFTNGLLIKFGNDYSVFSYANETIGSVPSTLVPAIYNNTLYFYNKDNGQVIDIDYNIYLPNLDMTFDTNTYIIYFDNGRIYQIAEDYYKVGDTVVEIAERKLKFLQNPDTHNLYAVSDLGKLWKLYKDHVEIVETENTVISLCSEKYVITKKIFGSQMFLEGYGENIDLDYPNNLYFVLLSYMLAIQFKVKQSADTTELQRLYEVAEQQFMESITSDANDYYQIKNVYKKDWRF